MRPTVEPVTAAKGPAPEASPPSLRLGAQPGVCFIGRHRLARSQLADLAQKLGIVVCEHVKSGDVMLVQGALPGHTHKPTREQEAAQRFRSPVVPSDVFVKLARAELAALKATGPLVHWEPVSTGLPCRV